MFKVDAHSLDDYFAFDPDRRGELEALDRLIRNAAPTLARYFHAGTPKGQPGMRFRMIGYGAFHAATASGHLFEWPTIGVALQKNYISVYVAPKDRHGQPITEAFRGRLGELRMGLGNFSFVRASELDEAAVSELFALAERLRQS